MKMLDDATVIDAWSKNTDPWTAAVRSGEIESRTLVTNQAIIDAVRSRAPRTALDIGCGEGWLVRALDGVDMIGVDVVAGLIDQARQAGGGDFRVLSYEQIAAGELQAQVDVAVCNFSLIGKESVEGMFRAARSLLNPNGALIVQTLHPLVACGDGAVPRWLARRQLGRIQRRLHRCAAVVLPHPGKLGRAIQRRTDCACWKCASRCIRTPASPCR